MKTLYKKILPLALSAAFVGGFTTSANAAVIAQSVLEITNFTFLNSDGSALDISQFDSLVFSDSSDISVTLNGSTSSASLGPINTFTGINPAQICLGGPCPSENDYSEKSVPTTTMARGDTLLSGAPIQTYDANGNPLPVGADAHTVAEAQLITEGSGSAQDNIGLVSTFMFVLDTDQIVGVSFDINAWLKAYITADSAVGSVAQASLNWGMSISDSTGATLFDWTPGGAIEGGTAESDCVLDKTRSAQIAGANSTYDCQGSASAYTDFALIGGDQYTLNLRHQSLADATFVAAVPEPATLALLGLGLVGIGFATRRRQS